MISTYNHHSSIARSEQDTCCKPVSIGGCSDSMSNLKNVMSEIISSEDIIATLEECAEKRSTDERENSIKTLNGLISNIHSILGNDHGLNDDPLKLKMVREAMESYSSNVNDWTKYANYSGGKYTRNLVNSGNGKFNLLILVWSPNTESPIHDHSSSHCMLKMLKGNLVEEIYKPAADSESSIDSNCTDQLVIKSSTNVAKNQVAYINDNIGYHRMLNPSDGFSVSLHLYSPAFDTCKIFNKETGQAQSASCNVYYTE
ncbi:Cysteine dioxygenase type 1 [Smittium culicis]|uniref:Cysteine dioxygenase n=1 Tax=Smittium culicis TaxID=133412 RepID=A0A1R1XCU5_9FUNG|nr:Cysteine dioxygenase type 1 [Smittium culicis]